MDLPFDIENFEEPVSLELYDQPLHGSLKIDKRSLPRIELDSQAHYVANSDLWNGTRIKKMYASTSGGQIYTLLNSQCQYNQIFPNIIIAGKDTAPVQSFNLKINDLSTFFFHNHSYKHNRKTNDIVHHSKIKTFLSTFQDNEQTYTIRNTIAHRTQSTLKSVTLSDEDYLVIKKTNGDLAPEEIQRLAQKICILFSLLMGRNTSIEGISLRLPRGNSAPLYFPCHISSKKKARNQFELLANSAYIFSQNLWETIFTSYFSTPRFKDLWNNLYSTLDFSGPWEYGLMQPVTILDRYCSAPEYNPESLQNLQDCSNLRTEIEGILEEYRKKNTDRGIKNRVDAIIEALKQENSKTYSPFIEKFLNMRKNLDPAIEKIIPFSTDEFKKLKTIRDSVAHCKPFSTQVPSYLDYEIKLKNKLITFLFYLVFKDLGFSTKDFTNFLSNTSNPRFKESINETELDRYTGDVPFYKLSHSFDEIKYPQNRFHIVVFLHKKANTCSISEMLSDLTINSQKHLKGSGILSLSKFVKDNLPDKSNLACEYTNKIYLEDSKGAHRVHSPIVVTYP